MVARHSSISGASKQLRISQSSIDAAIKIAEDEANMTIFTRRSGHGVYLTPAGQRFLVSANRFLAAGTEFKQSLVEYSGDTTATLRVGCFSPFGAILIPPILRKFIDANGECDVVLMEGDQTQLRSWLGTGEIDLAVTYNIGEEFGSGITPICKFPAHAVLRSDDELAKRKAVSMEELAKKPFILLDLPETRTYLLTLFDYTATRPKISLRSRSYGTIRSAVSSGFGVSILNIRPSSGTSPDSLDIKRIPISDKLKQPTLLVADPYGDRKPKYVRSFIHLLHRYFVELSPERFAVVKKEYSEGLIHPKPDFQRS